MYAKPEEDAKSQGNELDGSWQVIDLSGQNAIFEFDARIANFCTGITAVVTGRDSHL